MYKEESIASNSKLGLFDQLYLGFLVLLPVVYSKSLIDPVLLSRQLYLTLFLIVVSFFIFKKIKRRELSVDFSFLKYNLIKVFIGFFLIHLLSMFWSISLTEAMYTVSKYGLELCLFLITTYLIIQKALNFSTLFKGVLLLVVITFVIVGYQVISLISSEQDFLQNTNSLTGTFANKNLLASTLYLTIPFCFLAGKINRKWKYISVILLLLLFLLLWMLQTKAVVLALFFAFFVLIILFYKYKKFQLIKGRFKIVFLLVVIAIVSMVTILNKDKFSRLTSTKTAQTRINIWNNSNEMVSENWIKGVGAGNWKIYFPKYGLDHFDSIFVRNGLTVYQRPHNDLYWVLCETGVFGLALYTMIFIIALFYAATLLKQADSQSKFIYILLIASIVGYLIIALVDFPLERIDTQILLILLFSIIMGDYYRMKKPGNKVVKPSYIIVPFIFVLMMSLVVSIARIKGEYNSKKMQISHGQNNWNGLIKQADLTKNSFYHMDPTAAPIDWYNGVAHFQLGNVLGAQKLFENAYKEHPYNIHVINNLASCYEKLNQREKAIEYYLMALEIAPRFNEARLNLAAVNFNKGEVIKALNIISLYDNRLNDVKYSTYLPVILKANNDLYSDGEKDEKYKLLNNLLHRLAEFKQVRAAARVDSDLMDAYKVAKIYKDSSEIQLFRFLNQ